MTAIVSLSETREVLSVQSETASCGETQGCGQRPKLHPPLEPVRIFIAGFQINFITKRGKFATCFSRETVGFIHKFCPL